MRRVSEDCQMKEALKPVAWIAEFENGEQELHFEKPTVGETITPLYTTPPAAQPAVPDAFGTREGEHPQYIQGWNDCRQTMLEILKARGNT
jgi:hypothetical protein